MSVRLAALEAAGKALHAEIATLRELVQRSASAKLLAELDDLAGAVDSLRASNRREFGRLWGKIGASSPPADDGAADDGAADRDMLRAQYLRHPGGGL